ncbi:ras GTPase-activating protein 1-like [Actinia tenebrosa]|uniref:Ras GTPase-activating protein 1-like n=1 Tax=Actinia tenebrosa TaxID=6105 RepID=A0A6P8IWU2_ACTTE|nr:ras GTPase-activating protein 1-like [Actinia tenebrosa]
MADRDRNGSLGSDGVLGGENEADGHFEDEIGLDILEDDEQNIELASSAPPEDQWYHGKLDRMKCEERLNADGREGAYLVRQSDRKPDTYSLSYLSKNGVCHFRITAVCSEYYIGGRQFDSLSDLIGYYTRWSCLLKDEQLANPVPPPEPVTGKRRVVAKYTYNKTPDTDEISFCKGDVFIVDNVIDNDWLWVAAQKNKERGLAPAALLQDAEPDLDPHAGKPWYFGDITKDGAQELLMRDGAVGSFLIRPSDKSPGDYSLSLRYQQGVTRFLIRRQGSQYLMGGRLFDSIDDVVKRYKHEHIVEGLSLKEPVSRPQAWNIPHRPMTPNRGSDSIDGFTFMPQAGSVGPAIMYTSQQASKRGYLVMKGHRNKWKRMYFVLDGQEQKLSFYENEKRTKPKSLLDLTLSTVYVVHENFFGRPNCFQVVVRALNESRMTYLCADTQDQANEWMDAIKKFCGKAKTADVGDLDVKQLRSLELNVIEAHKLPPNKVSHVYSIISLNEVKTCRTRTFEGQKPIWNEDFKFNDLPADVTSVTISLYNRSWHSRDILIGSCTQTLQKLPKGQTKDDWYPLIAHGKAEVGNLRMRIKFTHEIIMPVGEYDNLKEILLDKDLFAVTALGQVCKDRVSLASSLLKIFRHEKQELFLLKTMNAKEIEKQDEQGTLFRGTSLATTLMDQYMKMVAIPYLQQTIKDVIVKIMECKQSCELNPAKMEKGADTVINLKQLLEFLFEAIEAIFNSADNCPVSLQYLFGCLQQNVRDKWTDNQTVQTRVVSGFLFLRLFCPAIMNPKLCNLMTDIPSATAARTLTLVAKCLQKLANLVDFGAKESCMTPVNPFMQKNRDKVIAFINEISSVNDCPDTHEQVSSDPARDLASLQDICVVYKSDLKQLSTTQPCLKKLVAVTEALQQREQQFIRDSR